MCRCEHCDVYGCCKLYSNIDVAVPCSGDYEGCEGYVEGEEDGPGD